jgi:ATP-dependent protease ClpP protease subunit
MSLVPAVTELLLAEMIYLQYDSPTKPVYLYINSTGVQVGKTVHRGKYRLFTSPTASGCWS